MKQSHAELREGEVASVNRRESHLVWAEPVQRCAVCEASTWSTDLS